MENKAILLDSCIISNLAGKQKNLAGDTFNLIKQLTEAKNSLYISEFTYYELIRSATPITRTKTLDLIKEYPIVPSNRTRLERAALLYSSYKNHEAIKKNLHSISDIDIFIGSLIFTRHKPLLLTADYNDFPRPFFIEKARKRMEFQNNRGNMQSIYYYFFEADLDAI